jgi:hypothetical protein
MQALGCVLSILGIIVLVFVLTHISEIWTWLERLFT